jgi:hypothetical protein
MEAVKNVVNTSEVLATWKKDNLLNVSQIHVNQIKSFKLMVLVLSVNHMKKLYLKVRSVLFHHVEIDPKDFFQMLHSKNVLNTLVPLRTADYVHLIHVH